ncbi:MAG: hypothetical protein SVK08_01680 [Halobacteriota archaeon]|nr:hypothetical protein [Halobacteriota archaeon]
MIEAEINWEWLETKQGKVFLRQLNKKIKKRNPCKCADISCPFGKSNPRCHIKCFKAFPNEKGCPCFTFESAYELAIILSDYYDMIQDEKI